MGARVFPHTISEFRLNAYRAAWICAARFPAWSLKMKNTYFIIACCTIAASLFTVSACLQVYMLTGSTVAALGLGVVMLAALCVALFKH